MKNRIVNGRLFLDILSADCCKNKGKDNNQIWKLRSTQGQRPSDETKAMVLIKGGAFDMGSQDPGFMDSSPIHRVEVGDLWMDEHEVTNAQFAQFVAATGYTTTAEQHIDPADYLGIPVEDLVPWFAVFLPPSGEVSLDDPLQWWQYVKGANWMYSFGFW